MKKIMTIAIALGLAMTAAAQHGRISSRVVVVSPGIGLGYGYYPYYYSPFGYPFGYPYGYYNNSSRNSSKLQGQIEDIKNDYKDKIWSAKQDKSLSKDERNNVIHQLKSERDKAINDLKTNYYKPQKTAPAQDPESNNNNKG